jgi:tetratricopeptide (TPR) repeat protein
LVAAGQRAEALAAYAAYKESQAIREKLAAVGPGNADWQHALSVSYYKIGDALVAAGQRAEALAAYQKGQAIREKLAATDPGNAGWQHDLSVGYGKIGGVLEAAGQRTEALAAYQRGRAIFEKLAAADPGNADWAREAAPHRFSLRERGRTDVLSRQGHGAHPPRHAHQR